MVKSESAKTAQQIRKELKEQFPSVKFSVRSEVGSIRIRWKDWPTQQMMEDIIRKYERVSRDQWGDILAGGNMFVFCSNEWSPEARAEIEARMPEGIDRYHIDYFRYFNEKANELYWEKYRAIVTAPAPKKKRATSRKRSTPEPAPALPAVEQQTAQEPEPVVSNWYEERQKQRAERYLERAEKLEQKAMEYYNSPANQTLSNMGGEPVKVGHHSEGRHRRLIKRAHRDLDKWVESRKKAEYYRQKAESVLNNKAISSDDPEAIRKLEERLKEELEAHEYMIQSNKEARRNGTKKPYATYQLSNSSARIRSLKDRIEELKRKAEEETKEIKIADGVTIIDNVEANRVQILFDSIPPEDIRTKLKQHGFRWSRRNKAWQRFRGNNAMYWAKKIASEMIAEDPAPTEQQVNPEKIAISFDPKEHAALKSAVCVELQDLPKLFAFPKILLDREQWKIVVEILSDFEKRMVVSYDDMEKQKTVKEIREKIMLRIENRVFI